MKISELLNYGVLSGSPYSVALPWDLKETGMKLLFTEMWARLKEPRDKSAKDQQEQEHIPTLKATGQVKKWCVQTK